MSEVENKESNPRRRDLKSRPAPEHNVDDINVWGIVKFAVGLLIIVIVAYIGLYGVLKAFERERLAAEARPPLMARGPEERLPPTPRLQVMPGSGSEFKSADYEMKQMLDEEEKTLESYGWLNKDAGIVRIPIDVAMERIVEKGLPSRPAAPAAPGGTESGPGRSSATRQGR